MTSAPGDSGAGACGRRPEMDKDLQTEIERDVVRASVWQLARRSPTWFLILVVLGAAWIAWGGR